MPPSRTKDGEDAAINLYCKQLNDFIKKTRPEGSVPPDAIIQRKNEIFEWVEVTSVWKGEHISVKKEEKKKHALFAKALNSSTSHGEIFEHHYPNGYWRTLEPDLISSIKRKDSNVTYLPFLERYGKGILILNLEDPYYGSDEVKPIVLSIEPDKTLTHFGTILLHLSAVYELRGGVVHSCSARLIPVILK